MCLKGLVGQSAFQIEGRPFCTECFQKCKGRPGPKKKTVRPEARRSKDVDLDRLAHLSSTLRKRALGQVFSLSTQLSTEIGFSEDFLEWKFRFFKEFVNEWDLDEEGDKKTIEGPLMVKFKQEGRKGLVAYWSQKYVSVSFPYLGLYLPHPSDLRDSGGCFQGWGAL